jgi:hypothetical protein
MTLKPVRETVARMVDPYSFMPDNSGDDLIGEMVRNGRDDALRKADRIISAVLSADTMTLQEPKRPNLDASNMKFGNCHQCGVRDNLGMTEDNALICGSCADANHLADWIDYARALRGIICSDSTR